MQPLVAQVHLALAREHHHARIENDLFDLRDSILRVEVRDSTPHRRLRLLFIEQQSEAARHVDARELGERLLDVAVGNDDRERAVRGRGEGVHRVAAAVYFQPSDQGSFEGRLRASFGMKLRELHVGEAHIEPLLGNTLADVDQSRPFELALGEGEGEGIDPQYVIAC